tara:strand:- start:43 stop:156 length:114 start_codon:yes stop_codon:yes gene_type:complete
MVTKIETGRNIIKNGKLISRRVSDESEKLINRYGTTN